MWPFRRSPDPDLVTLAQICDALRTLTSQVDRIEADQHRLRGYVYAKRGLVGPADQPPPAATEPAGGKTAPAGSPSVMTKAELRASMLRAGQLNPSFHNSGVRR